MKNPCMKFEFYTLDQSTVNKHNSVVWRLVMESWILSHNRALNTTLITAVVRGPSLSSCLTSCRHGHFRFGDVEVSAAAVDRKHVLSVPETSQSGGPFNEAQATNHHNATPADSCSSGDKWLPVQVFDIIAEDWHTWLGTLCFLLWLLYLMIL